MKQQKIKYKRILLKISGESLAGENSSGVNHETVLKISRAIKKCYDLGVEIAIVVGGGNFWRGRSNESMDRTRADHIGMLATIMNSLALADALEECGLTVRVQTSVIMQAIAEPYSRNKAIRHLQKGRVIILGGGTGSPYFSTDTAASLRAAEINAEIIFKASVVDGVYDCDPNENSDAKKFDTIPLAQVLSNNLKVMDMTAAAMCQDNKIPMLVFNINDPENIVRAVLGENIGTVVY